MLRISLMFTVASVGYIRRFKESVTNLWVSRHRIYISEYVVCASGDVTIRPQKGVAFCVVKRERASERERKQNEQAPAKRVFT